MGVKPRPCHGRWWWAAAAAAMMLVRLFDSAAVLHGRRSRKLWLWSERARGGLICIVGSLAAASFSRELISEFWMPWLAGARVAKDFTSR